MAEEEKKEEEKKSKEDKGEKKEGGSNKLVLIIVVVLLVLLIVVGAVLFLLMSGDDEEAKPAAAAAEQEVITQPAEKKAPIIRKATNNKDYLVVGTIVPAGEYIVNLLADNGRKYLKTEISFELVDDAVMAELEQKKPVLQHIIMTILSQKTPDEVSTRKGKEKLADEMVFEVNEALADGKIKHVFFTKFVVQ